MAGDIWVTYFSKLKMACNELSGDNNVYIKRWNLIALFHFEYRQVFLPHHVLEYIYITFIYNTVLFSNILFRNNIVYLYK